MPSNSQKMLKNWHEYRTQALEMAKKGRILISGEFCPEMEETAMEAIHVVQHAGRKTATVLINSFGGRNSAYNAIKGVMALSGIHFTGIVLGAASSNGFMLLQTCHKRLATPGSFVMFHWGSFSFTNSEIAALLEGETWPLNNVLHLQKETAKFVSQRTGVSLKRLYKYAKFEQEFPAKLAVKEGFIDKVIPELPFKVPNLD